MKIICEKTHMEMELKNAIEENQFRLYYQPKVDLVSGEIVGVEALVRWEHPEKGMIPPIEFIPFAEETGLIIPLGEWILRTACAQIKEWHLEGHTNIFMSVNLSARQLYQTDFADRVRQILKDTNLSPENISFEITEGMMLDSYHAGQILMELKHIGVLISLDDFGTGFNSFHHLQELPIDKIKIDCSFVRNCTTDLNDATIVKSIIEMAHQLKMTVVAEGIETEEQLIYLQQHLCNVGQGYMFNEPLPPKELMQNFHRIEQVVIREGIPQEVFDEKFNWKMMEDTCQDLRDTMRMQQALVFKYKKVNGKFIHTLIDGKLLYRMGISPKQVFGKELGDFLEKEAAEEVASYYRRAWDGEENVTFHGENNGMHLMVSLSPIKRGGRITEVVGSGIDITEQKQIEETLRIRESQFRIITENTQDLIRMIDSNNIVEYASPSHEIVLGYPPEAYEGKPIFKMMHPDDHARIQKQYADATLMKTSIQTELRLKHANGGWVDFEVKATPVFDEYDEFKHIVIMARDISERKKTERT